jgi:predicted RNase H-like HicB family nuclease
MSRATIFLAPGEQPPRTRLTTVVIPEEATDGTLVYRAEIPELPGCMSHGDTEEEALQNLQEALDLYLETIRSQRQISVVMADMSMPTTSGTTVYGALVRKRALGHIESKAVVVEK